MVEYVKYISELNAVSGNEYLIRNYILNNIKADNVKTDTMGNIIALKRGKTKSDKKIAVITNIDECGMIVTDVTDDGYIKFDMVGNVELRSIISKQVIINNSVKGVIGMKAIHLQNKEERDNVKKAKELYIDIGVKNKDDAKKIVNKGDYISFTTQFADLGDNVKGKALSRIGVYILMSIMNVTPEYDMFYIFTTQKEVGMRGAMIAANRLKLDYAYILDAVYATDVFGINEKENVVKTGAGPVISYSDKNSISDRKMTDKLISFAKESDIDVQVVAGMRMAGDEGEILLSDFGVKTTNIKIPVRYLNTPVQICSKRDIELAEKLLGMIIEKEENWQ